MQISKISSYNNLTFGEIFVAQDKKMTNEQSNVVADIIRKLRQSQDKFRNQTAENYYKSNSGMDFFVSACESKPDAVSLEGYLGVKPLGSGIDKAITYKESFFIGNYDKDSSFDINDIEWGIKNKEERVNMFTLPALAVIVGFSILIALGLKNTHAPKIKDTKPLIERVDSLSNSSEPVLKDTIRF